MQHIGTQTIETARLVLRKFSFADTESVWRNFAGDEQVQNDYGEPENCIGMVAYFLVDTHNQFCEIEYCIGKQFQNKGYISEAVKAITDYAFDKVGFNRVQVSCRSVNIPSKRVIEKCEFTYEGTLRQFFNHLGQFQDRMYYSLLREEWENGTQRH